MNYNLVLGVCLGLSVLLLAAAIIAGLGMRRAELHQSNIFFLRHIFTAFRVFLILFFVTTVCAVFPLVYFDVKGDILKSILAALINAFRLFFMAGDYVYACNLIGGCEGVFDWLSYLYLVYLACVYVVAPMFTLGFILSFFRDISSTFRYVSSRGADLYLFSELNERSLALAEDVIKSRREGIKETKGVDKRKYRELKRKRLIVFTDVFLRNEERIVELIASAKRLGAVCLKKDVTEIGYDLKKSRVQKIYLIGDDEDENIQQALTLINYHAGKKTDSEKLEFYVFSNSAESEALLTSVYNKSEKLPQKMKIRRINENRALALQELQDNPIFEGAIEEDGVKKIGLVLVGLGGYGTELLKAFSWCSQMAGYQFTLHVFDKEHGTERIRAIAPGLLSFNNNDVPLEAHYNIVFHDCVDVYSDLFVQELKKIKGITRIYVSLGDDEMNIETAMRVRSALETTRKWHPEIPQPPIFTIVYSSSKTDSLSLAESEESAEVRYGLKNMEGKPYNVFFIGALKTRYTLKNVERAELEDKAMPFHLDWIDRDSAVTEEERKAVEDLIRGEKAKYFQFEYYRNSSMAKAVHFDLRKTYAQLTGTEERQKTLQIYEHMRWNTYMRADGYTYAPAPKNHIAKTHQDLVAFDKLSKREQEKDK